MAGMREEADIAAELDALIARHYYSEDFELLSALRAYRDGLAPAEQDTLCAVVLQRLFRDGSIVDVMLCSVVHVPSAASVLAAKLDREQQPSQLTRALLDALQHYHGDDVFAAVERFVDSDQEGEALQALARIDFARSAPHLVRALQKDHLLDRCLHIFHARMKRVGRAALSVELRSLALRTPAIAGRLARALQAKRPPFNPLSDDDLAFLLEALS